MLVGTLFLLSLISLVCRCILFKKYDLKWWKAIIPGLNKYEIGTKLAKNKKLAIINTIVQTLLYIYSVFYTAVELWVLQTYATAVYVPKDGSTSEAFIQVMVPKDIYNRVETMRVALIIFGAIALIVWCMMMWKFTMQQKRSPWWILLWAAAPIIPYIAFIISKKIIIDGKQYITKRVEVT